MVNVSNQPAVVEEEHTNSSISQQTMAPTPSNLPRPLFVYGTLQAKPLLAWALTGDASNVDTVSPLMHIAQVSGYKRLTVHHSDYPAVIKTNDFSMVSGHLIRLETVSQRKKLDDFEGELYTVVPIAVQVLDKQHNPTGEIVDADMYIWNGEMELLGMEDWELDYFIENRLEDWLDLFEGMVLVGDDDSPSFEK